MLFRLSRLGKTIPRVSGAFGTGDLGSGRCTIAARMEDANLIERNIGESRLCTVHKRQSRPRHGLAVGGRGSGEQRDAVRI